MRRRRWAAWVVSLVTGILGLVYIVLGAWLAASGGSVYYAPAGCLLLASAVMFLRRPSAGLLVYCVFLVATALWTYYDVGLDGWQWMPRLLVFGFLGLALAWVGAAGAVRRGVCATTAILSLLVLAAILGLGIRITHERTVRYQPVAAASATTDNDNDWIYYGRTPAGQRFSPARQITPANADELQPAWTYHTSDTLREGEDKAGREFNFETTPVKRGNRLYLCTPHRQVIALDATTGKEVWRFDPKTDTRANEYLACRGVALYETGDTGACHARVLSTTADARLFALDADTGKLCDSFGQGGYVSLKDKLGEVPPGFHFITSQPLVIKDRLLLSGWIYDNQSTGEPSGVVRAYDPRTGELAWAWDLGKSSPTAPLAPGETYTRGTPNAWGTYTADPALGLVYLPLGNATPDYYGGKRRPFDDAYSSSLVALDIETGQERWHFQTVHHDVWDYDLPIGPTLVDLPGAQGPVPALVQTTKLGQLFVLDRRTGKPIAGVEERHVPTDPHLEDEHLSPTQPYSTGFPSLTPPDLKESNAWGATPVDHLMCRLEFKRSRYQGQYTPPALGKSIAYPAFDGVVDWFGASVDPTRHLLIANTSYIPFVMETLTHDDALRQGLMKPWAGWGSGQPYPKPKEFAVGPQYGLPFVTVVNPWLSFLDAPCAAPPWGKLVAIDLVSRKIAWEEPVGTTRDMNVLGIHTNAPLPTGIYTMGGNIVTAGGVIFMGATADDYLRAFDVTSGKELWKGRLDAGGQATPITYIGEDGRQYVVIAAGGHGGLRTRSGDSVQAFALPRR
ncbi:quinoprotein glucose dehydrogenase [Luteibacter sp. W1I16]